MPNRIIREGILTSERVDKLGPHAEVFYRRLMSVVDDYGRFTAHPSLLRAACYPLRIDKVREADISRLLAEVQEARLIVLYDIDAKAYLEVIDFKQQVRAKRSKYPCRPDAQQMISDAQHVPADAHSVAFGDEVDIKPPLPPSRKRKPNGNGMGWDLKEKDLKDAARIIAWMRHTKLVDDTHANELNVLAATERAMSVEHLGGANVQDRVAYFVSIVRDRNWKVITDTDRGRAKLRHATWSRSVNGSVGAQLELKSPEDDE